MPDESRDYRRGFAAGWLAASQALMNSLSEAGSQRLSLELAGSLPGNVRRRRGRPPKSAGSVQPSLQEPPKRRRGRPRKSA